MDSIKSFKGVFYAIISSTTFGLIPLFAIPPVREGMMVNSVVFYRFLFSTIAVGIALTARKTSFRITRDEFSLLFALGVLYASTSLMLMSSYFYIGSGTATTIHFLYPLFVALAMTFVFKERSTAFLYVAVVLALGGVYLLSGMGEGGDVSWKGYFMAFSTVLTYAGYILIVNRTRINRMNGLKATFWVLLIGTCIFLVNSLATDGDISAFPNWGAFADLLLLSLLCTLVSDLTLILAIQHIGSTITAILGCMEPLTAVAVSVLFLGENCSAEKIAGIIIILCAVVMVIYSSRRKSKAS